MHLYNGHYFSSNQNIAVYTRAEEKRGERERETPLCEDPRNLGARDRGLSDYYSESSILESSARR